MLDNGAQNTQTPQYDKNKESENKANNLFFFEGVRILLIVELKLNYLRYISACERRNCIYYCIFVLVQI